MEENLSRQFDGKVAVVTGGTQGLGAAVARMFARRGAAGVVFCGRGRENGKKMEAELGGRCKAVFVPADLARVGDCFALMECADREFGRVDALANCAASTERGNILDTAPAFFDDMFAVNVRAPFFLMQAAAKMMRREKIPGAMVNILSVSGHGGQPFICAYSGSKGALAVLTKNIAFALAPDRIRVNGLNIGWMNTPGEDRIQKTRHDAPDDWLRQAAQTRPFGRLLEPDEVARAVAFLCAEESGMMTGAIVDFDQSVLGCYEDPPMPAGRLQAKTPPQSP